MRELDDAKLELELRRVLSEQLGTLTLDLTRDALERRRAIRDGARRRRRNVVLLGLAAAVLLPAGWLAAGAPAPRPAPLVTVVTPSPSPVPSVAPEPTHPIVEELGRSSTGQLSAFGSALLSDGRVLLVGGVDTTTGQHSVATALLFDPVMKRFEPTGEMRTARTQPHALTLADGRVLVLGGWSEVGPSSNQTALSSAELYDPTTGTFAPAAGLPDERRECPCGALNRLPWALIHATLLPDGRVFVAGGDVTGNGAGATKADVFSPTTGRWDRLDIGCDAARSVQAPLADGRLLIVCVEGNGGRSAQSIILRARLFDPATDTFTEASRPLAPARVATSLSDGRILLTGFQPMLYDGSADSFVALPTTSAVFGSGIDIGRGRVLFLGDQGIPNEPPGQPALIFDAATGSFAVQQQPGFTTADAVVPLPDGRILTVGYQLEVRLLDPGQLP